MNRERFIALPSRLGVPFRSSRVFFLLAMFFSYFSSFACSEGCFRREAKMSAKRAASGEVCAKNSLLPFVHTWNLERLFSITSSSRKLCDYSGVFPAGGYAWKLALKYGELEAQEGKSYLTLFLVLVDASPPPSDIEVVLEASVVDENCSQRSKRKATHRSRQSKSEQCPYLISLETLECHSSGFVVAEIVDVVIHSEGKASLSPKPDYNSPANTWKIDGFSKLTKQSYNSGPFLYNDHIWYLTIHPKGHLEEKGKSVSLFLYLDDASNLASSEKIRAAFYFDWVDQIIEKNHMYAVTGPNDFGSKSSGWGWSKFLSLDALHEPSRGLLVNDTCIIKVGFCKCDVSK